MPALLAITLADEQLLAAGLVSYTDLLQLLNESAKLGLTFDIGTAYIPRTYIDQQTALRARIRAANTAVQDEVLLAELARPLTATEQALVDELSDGPQNAVHAAAGGLTQKPCEF